VAVETKGSAVVVWCQSNDTCENVWANRYSSGSWGTGQLIETQDEANARFPEVAVDSSGNAIAVWSLYDGIDDEVWANRYVAGQGWGTAQHIETSGSRDIGLPQVSVDSLGNAVVVWHQNDGAHYNIWSNRYAVGSGWGTPELIETNNMVDAAFPDVSVDYSGNAVAVWFQSDGTRYNIWANHCVSEEPMIPEFSTVIVPLIASLALVVQYAARRRNRKNG
jgi:hypothetical protein